MPRETYSAAVAIESLEHSSGLRATLANLGGALRDGATLVVVTDLLSAREESAARRGDPRKRNLRLYSRHWCGPQAASWAPPATRSTWEADLAAASLDLVMRTDLSSRLYARPRSVLAIYLELLLALHHSTSWLRLPTTAMHLSTQIGGVARELLLHDESIEYTFLVARRRPPTLARALEQ